MATRKYSNKRKRRVNRFDTGGITPFNALNFGDYGLTPQDTSWTPQSEIQSIMASGDNDAINQLKSDIAGDHTSGVSGGSGGLSGLAKGAIGAAAGAIGSIGGNLLSGGLQSGAGSAISSIGSTVGGAISAVNPLLGGIVSGASGILGGATNALFGSKINQEKVNEIEGGIDSLNTLQVDDSSTNSILNQFGNTTFGQSFSKGDIGKDGIFSSKAKNTYNRLKEEQAEAINRALGNFSNAASNVQSNQVNEAMRNFAAYGGPITMRYTGPMSPFGNTFADGGGIHIKKSKRGTFTAAAKKHGKSVQAFASQVLANKDNYSPAMVKKANFARNASKWHSDGGWLNNTHGGIFDNGVTTIGNGGTHEQNPFEGIQLGVDNQGIPNLVEEGEVIFNDYVYSNRIKAPKEVKKKYKLRGNTFADLAENAQKESAERPNDPISQRGLQDIMTKLAMEQESIREKKASRSRKYAHGGKLGRLFEGPGPDPNFIYNPYAAMNSYGKTTLSGEPLNDAYKTWEGFKWYNPDTRSYTPEYSSDLTRSAFMNASDEDIAKFYNESSLPNFYRRNSALPTRQEMWDLAHDYNYGDMHQAFGNWLNSYLSSGVSNPMTIYTTRGRRLGDISINPEFVEDYGYRLPDDIVETTKDADGNTINYLSNSPRTPIGSSKPVDDSKGSDDEGKANPLTYLRYAPILGSAIGLTQGLLSKPDYSGADAVLEATRDAGRYMPIDYKPIGNYLAYTPLDRDYYINKLASQAGAARRAIAGQSAGNRATAMAGLLASDYNAQTQIGDMMRRAAEYNFDRRKDVETFNRTTNQFNSEQALKADMANQEAYSRSAASRLSGTAQAMKMRQAIDDARNASIAANFGNIFQTLGDIGREEVEASWIKDNPALYYYFARNGEGSEYKGKKASYGGYITRKNKKKGGKR